MFNIAFLATLQVSSGTGRGDGRQEEEEEEEGKVARAALVGGLSSSDKRRLVARYGDLSNDEDDDTYPPQSSHIVHTKVLYNVCPFKRRFVLSGWPCTVWIS